MERKIETVIEEKPNFIPAEDPLESDKEVETSEIVLKIENLVKSYGSKEVLKGIDLEVKKGEVFGFIGKNGIGKSTTIDCIVGTKEFDDGHIYVLGKDNKIEELFAKTVIGYVPSEPVTYEVMTGKEYLRFIATCYGMSHKAFNNNYNYLINKLDMSEADMDRRIKEYSHGMKQKVCIMASLIHNPKIWILDEPTVGLDIMIYEKLIKMIKDYATYGKTVFITSHNIDLVSKVCDRVAIINKGKVVDLLDFTKDPIKRRDLLKCFMKAYEE